MGSIGVPSFRRVVAVGVVAILAAGLCLVGGTQLVLAAPKPSPACVPEQPDREAAQRMVAVCGRPVEILSERSEYSQVFLNTDGTQTLEQNVEPRRVRQDGRWVPVNLTLKRTAAGIVPRASALPMVFSGGGDGLVGRLAIGAKKVSLSWPGKLPKPKLKGDTAVYPNVLPDVDLRVTATATGFSEVLVVRTRKAAAHPKLAAVKFGLDTVGVTVRSTRAGGLRAHDADGKEVFTSPAPLMWDSSGPVEELGAPVAERPQGKGPADGVTGEEPIRRAVMPLKVGGGSITVNPDQKMLADPQTKFPVYIDPLVTGGISGNAWTSVWSKYPTRSFWQNTTALTDGSTFGSAGVGRTEDCIGCADHKVRSFFRMDTSKVKGTVLAATFSIEQRWSWTCSPASDAKVWKTGEISSSTTWDNQPTWNNSVTAQVNGNRKYGAVHGCKGPAAIRFNAKNMVTSGKNTVTLGLKAIDEGTKNQWKRFKPSTATLSVTFNQKPSALSDRKSDGRACIVGKDRPYVLHTDNVKLTGTQKDPDADQQDLTTTFYWWVKGTSRNNTNKVSQSNGNNSPVTGSVPSNNLVDGQTYVWQAVTTDNVIPNSTADETWSGLCEFTVDETPPPAPGGITSTDYSSTVPSGGVGVDGTFKIDPPTDVNRRTEVLSYAYSLVAGQYLDTRSVPVGADYSGSVTLRPVTDGVNTLSVWSVDRAGRKSTAVTYVFTVRIGSGPAAAWTFEPVGGVAGTAYDMTEHGNALTLGSGATRIAGRGGEGNALSLNGTAAGSAAKSSALTYPHPTTGAATAVRTDTSFTVMARVKLAATGGTAHRVAIAASGSRTSAYTLGYSGTDNKWRFAMAGSDADNATSVQVLSNAASTAGKWTHLTGVYNASTKKLSLYVNGVLQTGTATLTGGFNATGSVTVGKRKWNGADDGFLSGAVDDVRVYSFIETAAKIGDAAAPLAATISFPDGEQAKYNGTLRVTFSAGGDTNVTKFRYSIDGADLGTTVNAAADGTATVTINVGETTGSRPIYAAADDGIRSGPRDQALFTVLPGTPLFGTVLANFIGAAGVTVTLQPGGHTAVTDADGIFAFGNFAEGNYTVTASDGTRCGMAGSQPFLIDGQGLNLEIYLHRRTDRLGHTCSQRSVSFATGTTVLPLTGDDAVTKVTLPFAFPFYGNAYRTVWVDTNGLLSFTDPGRSYPYPGTGDLITTAEPNALIAPFWDDLVVDSQAGVRTAVTGAAGSERVLFEWRNVHRKGNSAQRLSFEVTLAFDGTVTTNYDGLDDAAEQGDNALVGIEAPAGDDGYAYSSGEPVLSNGTAVVFTRPEGTALEVHNLTGTVTDSDGAPVAGAPVTADPTGLSTTTAADGTYSFSGMVADSYTVTSHRGDRCSTEAEVQVDLFTDTVQDLQLVPDYGSMGYACSVDVSGYASADTPLGLTGDDVERRFDLPFDMTFYGRTGNTATISTNGWVDVAGGTLNVFSNDLVVDQAASMWTRTAGTAPGRSYVIEWRNVLFYGTTERTSFELVMYEDGRVAYHYGAMTTDLQKGKKATIGIGALSERAVDHYSDREPALNTSSSITYVPAAPSDISGVLTAADTSEPVAGATVALNPGGQTITTDWDGSFRFSQVPVGEYTVATSYGDERCFGQYATVTVAKSDSEAKADLSLNSGADPFYNCTNGDQPFVPGDTVRSWSGDDEMWQVTPPFPIQLYGESHTSAWISSNGVVGFKPTGEPIDGHAAPIPATDYWDEADGTPNNAVYAFWADWIVDSEAAITTKIDGVAPNRQWVVEWRNVRHHDDEAVRVTFAAVFSESGGITLNYDGIDPANAAERGESATVGIESSDGTSGFQYLYDAGILSDELSINLVPAVPSQNSITGTVTCLDTPLGGVTVAAAGNHAVSAADGTYRIDGVPTRNWPVVATVTGGTCQGSTVHNALVGRNTPVVNFALAPPSKGPEFTNTVAEVAVDYVPVSDGTVLPINQDQTQAFINLPFPVKLYGAMFNQTVVDAGGQLGFEVAYLYPFMDDWIVDSNASVRTRTRGSAPTRQFVIEWNNVRYGPDPNVRTTFQAVLAESGSFTFVYPRNDGTFVQRGGTALIGVNGGFGEADAWFGQDQPVLRPGTGLRLVSLKS